jgi:hypothetical protein
MPSAHAVGVTRGALGQPVQRRLNLRHLTGPGGRLGQFGYDQVAEYHIVALEDLPGGIPRGLVPAQPVVQYGARVRRRAGQDARTAWGRLLDGGLDQFGGLLFPALPGGEHHRGISDRRVAGHLRDQVIFFDQPLRHAQLAGEQVEQAEEVERDLQVDEGARLAGDLNLAGGQGIPGLEVPQLHGDDAAGSPAGQPEPAAGFSGAGVQGYKQLQCPGQRRRSRRVPLRQP